MKKNILLFTGLVGTLLLGGCKKEDEESVFISPPTISYDASQLKPFYKLGDTIKISLTLEPHSRLKMKAIDVIRVYGPYSPPNLSGTDHELVNFDPPVDKYTYPLFLVLKKDQAGGQVITKEPDGTIRLTFAIDCTAENVESQLVSNPVSVFIKE